MPFLAGTSLRGARETVAGRRAVPGALCCYAAERGGVTALDGAALPARQTTGSAEVLPGYARLCRGAGIYALGCVRADGYFSAEAASSSSALNRACGNEGPPLAYPLASRDR